ncbi:MAG: hypothetical protein AABZ39_11815 [Spirochaetota bacterium]
MDEEITRFHDPFYITYLGHMLGVAAFLLSLFIFFTGTLGDEYRIVNAWTKSASDRNYLERDTSVSITGDMHVNHITLGEQFVHYFEKNGATTYFMKLGRNDFAACGRDNFIIYNRYGDKISCYDITGRLRWMRETKTYPEFAAAAGSIALHTSEHMSFSLIDDNNNDVSQQIRAGEFITDSGFARHTGDYAAGYINGQFCYIYRTGKMSFLTSSILSTRNVVKAIALSEYGSFVGVISGLFPEYISVYTAEGRLVWYKKTDLMRRRTVSLTLNETANALITLRDYGIAVYGLKNGHVRYYLPLNDAGMEFATYMKADISGNNALASVCREGSSRIFLIDYKQQYVAWKNTIDTWTYDVGFSSRGDEFVVTTDKFIYCYKRLQL